MQYPRRSRCRPTRRDARDALFSRVRVCRKKGDCPWMNRRNDRAIIPWRGIFEIKRLAARCGAARYTTTKLAYEVHLRVRNVRPREYALRENSVALVPSNETFNNFPRRGGRRRTYLRYYVENIQPAMLRHEMKKKSARSIVVFSTDLSCRYCNAATRIINMRNQSTWKINSL